MTKPDLAMIQCEKCGEQAKVRRSVGLWLYTVCSCGNNMSRDPARQAMLEATVAAKQFPEPKAQCNCKACRRQEA